MGGKHRKTHSTPSTDLDLPSVGDCFTGSLTSSAANISEGGTVTYTATLTGGTSVTALSIPYTLSGTGITTGDFGGTALTGNINIAAGATTGTLTLNATNDLTTEGTETLTVTLGAAAGVNLGTAATSTTITDTSTTPVGPVVNTIALAIGSTAPVAATAGNDLVTFDVAAAKASAATTQINVTGFSTANDSWTVDLPVANPAITTLAQLNGQQGVTAFPNGITGNTDVTFGTNAAGNAVAVSLVGVTDLTVVKVLVI